jgi:hypothetical protein
MIFVKIQLQIQLFAELLMRHCAVEVIFMPEAAKILQLSRLFLDFPCLAKQLGIPILEFSVAKNRTAIGCASS